MYIFQAFCALVIASLCTDVEALRWWIHEEDVSEENPFPLISREVKALETSMFKVTCTGNCIVKSIEVKKHSGTLELSAESATTVICSKKKTKCLDQKVLQEKVFFIYLKPNPSFRGGKLHVRLGTNQTGKIYEVRHEGAIIHRKNSLQINSGYFPVKLPNLLPQYKITCDGICKDIEIEGRGYDFMIAASEYPLSVKKGGCRNCFCDSSKSQGYAKSCKIDGSSIFNLQKDRFYITLLPDEEVKDAQAFVKGSNFKEIQKLEDSDMLKVNYKVASYYYPTNPGLFDKESMLWVICGFRPCTEVKVEVLGGPKLKTVRLGKLNDAGDCIDCISCTGASCQRRVDPPMFIDETGIYDFDIFIETEVGDLIHPAYVKISCLLDWKLKLYWEW